MKLVAVGLSDKCIKNPRCCFCYQDKNLEYNRYKLADSIRAAAEQWPEATFCFEYNGYNLDILTKLWGGPKKTTMTTMPETITNTLCGFLKKYKISAISISYDSEKVKKQEDWIAKAKIVRKHKLLVGCNYLIENIPTRIPADLLKEMDQLNLLALKPTGEIPTNKLDILRLEIEKYKSIVPVVTDNCLGVQLGNIEDCRSGVDFIHITPSGERKDCCFGKGCFLHE